MAAHIQREEESGSYQRVLSDRPYPEPKVRVKQGGTRNKGTGGRRKGEVTLVFAREKLQWGLKETSVSVFGFDRAHAKATRRRVAGVTDIRRRNITFV